jgi:hypothetical protein
MVLCSNFFYQSQIQNLGVTRSPLLDNFLGGVPARTAGLFCWFFLFVLVHQL